jgi:hypothetical protein
MIYFLTAFAIAINIALLLLNIALFSITILSENSIKDILKMFWEDIEDTTLKITTIVISVTSMVVTFLNVTMFPFILLNRYNIPINIFTIVLSIVFVLVNIHILLTVIIFYKDVLITNQSPLELIKESWEYSINIKQKLVTISYIFYTIVILSIIILTPILLIF